jgi:hypothetical protein
MRRKLIAAVGSETHAVRLAWWASFLATLALIALLGLAKSAQALSLSDPGPGLVPAAAPAEEGEEGEAEASEDAELEAEECDADEGECEEEGTPLAPAECLVSSADSTILAFGNRDKVRLQIRYTTSFPTAVAVDYGLHGTKGSLFLGGEKKRFGKEGVLRLNKSLAEAQMAKVMAARDFTVRVRALAAPRWCRPFFEHHLTIRRATPRGLTWLQAE